MKTKRKALYQKRSIIYNSPSNLPFDDFLVQNDVVKCEPRYIVKQCGCGRTVFPTGCMRKNCTVCTKRLNARRAFSAFNRFQVYKRAKNHVRKNLIFCYTDFTIPPYLRQGYTEPKNWQRLRAAVWQLIKRRYGAVFALEGTHPIGDKHPDVFHPHLNFVWVLRDGFQSYIDLEELRDFFKVLLGTIGPVNVWHQYGQDDAQLMHWCKYVTRIFPEFSNWAGHTRWYGRYPKYKPVTESFCSKCGQRFISIGYVNAVDINNFEERGFYLGRAPPWENDMKITFFKRYDIA
ncbi:hypothetical protein ES703_22479 [subsurface metagenome]